MSEMVERVARAILDKCEEFESRKGDVVEFDSRELARAAKEHKQGEHVHGWFWRAMVDEALRQ